MNLHKVFTFIFLHFLFLGIFNNSLSAQQFDNIQELNQKFRNYEIISIESQDLYNNLNLNSRNNEVTIPLGEGMKWVMELELNPIFSSRYSMVYGQEVYGNPTKENRVKPMVGSIKNVPDSRVALSFNTNFIYGEVIIGRTSYFIEPLSYYIKNAEKDQFIYYSINDVILTNSYKCGYEKGRAELNELVEKEEIPGTRMPGGCFIVEYALAADWSMVIKYGSDIGVENFITGVVNNVQNNYDNEFADEIQFEIVTFWISSCSTCDPWSPSTDPFDVLPTFRNWGNSGGFGSVVYDVASMWTNRVYIDGIVGLASVGVVCTNSRYNLLRDFTSNPNFLRVMNSHELGHNFNASHDASGSNTIMAPSVNSATSWSSSSITSIQNHYLSRTCLSGCNTVSPPVADFTYNVINPCVVGQVQYTDQSSNATSWAWSFPGGTPATSTQQNPLVTYNNAGVYGATLIATNSAGSSTKTLNNIVTISNFPTPSFTYIVSGPQVTFTNTSTNATSYSWDFGDGFLSSMTNPVHVYLNDGFYNVVLTAYNACGPADFSIVIEIATPPIAEFSANPTSGCSPLSVNFQDESTNNVIQWSWTFEGGIPNTAFTQNPSIIYNQPGVYSVTLTVANLQGSNTFVRQQYIQVLANPISSFTFASQGLTVDFTNTSTNATNYLWNFGDGNTSTVQNPTHTYATIGTYTVTLESSNSCSTANSSQSIGLSIAPIASFTTNNNPNGCSPYIIQFVNTSQNNPTSFLWTFEGGIPATSTEQNPTITYSNPGNFDVTLIANNTLGSDTIESNNYVNIETIPNVDFSYTGDELTYQFISSIQNGNIVSWNFGDGNMSTVLNPEHIYTAEGTYIVELTAQNDCGTSFYSQQIEVIARPTAQFSADILMGCSPLSVQYSDESSPNTTQWNWSFPGGTPASSSVQNPIVIYNSPGQYDATLIALNAAGQDVSTVNNYITVNTSPTAGFTMTADGPNITMTNTGLGANSTEWQIQENGLQSLLGNTVTYTFSSNGSFSIRQINSNECGSNNLEQYVTINVYPVANFVGNADGNCAPVSIQFNNTSINGSTYVWSFENGTPSSSTEQNPLVVFSQGGQHDITLTTTNQYGSHTNTQTITVLQTPQPAFSFSTNTLTIQFTNQTSGNGNTYLWEFGDGTTSTHISPSHVYPGPGTYPVTLTVTNVCGSLTLTNTIVIDDRSPVVDFSASPQIGCAPLQVQFSDASLNDPQNWNWTFEGGNPAISLEKNPIVVYEQEGLYPVRLTVSNGFGSNELLREEYITVYGIPTAEFEYEVVEGNVDIQYTGNLVSAFYWEFGDGGRSTQQSPTYTYSSPGTYTIVLIVENPCGNDTITKEIVIDISSTKDAEWNNVVKVVPNPNNGLFNVIFDKMEGQIISIEIYNMLGSSVQRFNHIVTQKEEWLSIDISQETSGTYLMKIVNKDGQYTLKKISVVR
ncbi:MAG: PKD domain-containing protein [Saprospiraceae bacterium]